MTRRASTPSFEDMRNVANVIPADGAGDCIAVVGMKEPVASLIPDLASLCDSS